ncbi:ArsR family transcriptional regulator [Streptomyces sp. NPDC003035]|uniref:ArsR/SmtB family transcription factor n=1 Tax=Streptomyces sp. NPDC003035 TaxID=3364676 RepID=UPI0036A1647F
MLTLEFSAGDLARSRFARSPLWEVVTSIESLKDPGRHALHLAWARDAGERLARDRVRFPLLAALVPVPAAYVPDFLTPVPESGEPTLDDEIDRLLRTGPEAVRADLDRISTPLPRAVAELYEAPARGLARLADEIRAYWETALAPHWPRIVRLLDGEILRRGRLIARGGTEALFADLHPSVGWDNGILRVAHPGYEASRALNGGQGLVLVPSVFVWPGVFSQSTPPNQPGLVYPARGIGTLWERGRVPVPEAVAGVLGRSRALLLMELGAPASTTELAERTGMPTPTVSHHLTALRAAGLTVSHRAGRSVLYLRTELAERLLGGHPENSLSVPPGLPRL